eukprot:NODE_23129_length_679_cov_2.887681.p5 GENE.NODE_23129_length_679_cov_2.887681~~NODE_23129_length_679_cov_2.887681.p5  ORF type:complete len:55 (-),score=23.87 NODE_23129_length_679_cov_2.887681:264-428(-)
MMSAIAEACRSNTVAAGAGAGGAGGGGGAATAGAASATGASLVQQTGDVVEMRP